jgi:hypothetical protein
MTNTDKTPPLPYAFMIFSQIVCAKVSLMQAIPF